MQLSHTEYVYEFTVAYAFDTYNSMCLPHMGLPISISMLDANEQIENEVSSSVCYYKFSTIKINFNTEFNNNESHTPIYNCQTYMFPHPY